MPVELRRIHKVKTPEKFKLNEGFSQDWVQYTKVDSEIGRKKFCEEKNNVSQPKKFGEVFGGMCLDKLIFWKKNLFVLSTWKLTVGYIILLSLPNMSVPEWVGAGVVEECSKFCYAYIILILYECQQQEFVQQQQACSTWFLDQFLFCCICPASEVI